MRTEVQDMRCALCGKTSGELAKEIPERTRELMRIRDYMLRDPLLGEQCVECEIIMCRRCWKTMKKRSREFNPGGTGERITQKARINRIEDWVKDADIRLGRVEMVFDPVWESDYGTAQADD